ncbi:zinc knuckle CX2CX4HX4C containing protein [Tanacetum coccineum]
MATPKLLTMLLSILAAYLCVFDTVFFGQFDKFSKYDLPTGVIVPESEAFGVFPSYGPFTTVTDGMIMKWQGSSIGFVDFAYTTPTREVFKEGVELLRSIATRMNKMTGKGVNPNTSSDLSSLNEAQPQTEVRGSDLQVNNVETLFGVKFTSLSDIDDFSMSIKEGKYADILSTMSSVDIDADVNVIETIGKKFQDEVNKAGGTQLSSSPKVSTSSPLVSPSTTINMPRELNSIDVAATFGVPLTTVGDLHKLINDIEAGSICYSIQANCNNLPSKVFPSDPIVQSMDINTKSTSYAGAAGASTMAQPQVNSNFRPVNPVFNGVNISIPHKVIEKVGARLEHTLYGYFIGKRLAFPVVEYYARNNWGKHELKRVMMNTKGFFFFKFESKVGLEAVLESGPWMIRNTPIILKKWSMSTSLLKEELTRIPIWVKLHDVPLQVFDDGGYC